MFQERIYVGDEFMLVTDVDLRILMRQTNSADFLFKRSPIYQIGNLPCQQHIWCQTSVTNIDVKNLD